MDAGSQANTAETTALFTFLADTLGDAARRIERLEVHAADMIGASPQSSELLVVLQDFDLVRQMIEDVAGLSAAAARDGAHRRQRLAATLRLKALRDRLLHGPEAGGEDAGAGGGNGKVDLFGDASAPGARHETGEAACSPTPP
jgi:hypothetical protein